MGCGWSGLSTSVADIQELKLGGTIKFLRKDGDASANGSGRSSCQYSRFTRSSDNLIVGRCL